MRVRMIKGRNVTPPTPDAQIVLSTVNQYARGNKLKPLEIIGHNISYTMVFKNEINELFYEFEQIKDVPAYLHDEHPAKVMLKQLYDLIKTKVAEDNKVLLQAQKNAEIRDKNNQEVEAKVATAQKKFFEEIIKIELNYNENEDVLCHLSASEVIKPFDPKDGRDWHTHIRSEILKAKA